LGFGFRCILTGDANLIRPCLDAIENFLMKRVEEIDISEHDVHHDK